jgi:xanthine/uracil/vitamin C permease (AzgA family)
MIMSFFANVPFALAPGMGPMLFLHLFYANKWVLYGKKLLL